GLTVQEFLGVVKGVEHELVRLVGVARILLDDLREPGVENGHSYLTLILSPWKEEVRRRRGDCPRRSVGRRRVSLRRPWKRSRAIADCRLRIADCGSPRQLSANPQSAQPRRVRISSAGTTTRRPSSNSTRT